MSGLIEEVNATDEEVIITKNGRPAAVLVSPEEFEGWRETIAIRSNEALMKEIRKGLKALKTGKVRERRVDELFE